SDGAGVEVIASDDDRRLHLLLGDEAVEEQSRLGALAVAEPADARRESLELDALLGHADPAMQRGVVREELEDGFVGGEEIRRIAAERRPSERTFSLAEERPDEERHEAADVEGILHAGLVA